MLFVSRELIGYNLITIAYKLLFPAFQLGVALIILRSGSMERAAAWFLVMNVVAFCSLLDFGYSSRALNTPRSEINAQVANLTKCLELKLVVAACILLGALMISSTISPQIERNLFLYAIGIGWGLLLAHANFLNMAAIPLQSNLTFVAVSLLLSGLAQLIPLLSLAVYPGLALEAIVIVPICGSLVCSAVLRRRVFLASNTTNQYSDSVTQQNQFFVLGMISFLTFNADIQIISHFSTPLDVAIYGLISKYCSIILLAFAGIVPVIWNNTVSEQKAGMHRPNTLKDQIYKILATSSLLSIPVLVIMALTWRHASPNTEFEAYPTLFALLIFSMLQLVNGIYSIHLNAINVLVFQIKTSLIVLLLKIPLSLFLTAGFGSAGAVSSSVAAMLLLCFIYNIKLQKERKLQDQNK